MSRKVLHYRAVRSTPPWGLTVVGWLLLDRLHAPGWAWGAAGLFCLIVWITSIYGMFTETMVDIFEGNK